MALVLPYPSGIPFTIGGGPGAGTHAASDWQSGNAVDVSLKPGTPVLAVAPATVVRVSGHDPDAGVIASGGKRIFGYSVTIREAGGREWFYTHLGDALVRPGQRVAAGAPLGTVGAFPGGGSHLHLGVSEGDPRAALAGKAYAASGPLTFTRGDGSAQTIGLGGLLPGLPDVGDLFPSVPGVPGLPDLAGALGVDDLVGYLFDPLKKPLVRLALIVGGVILFVVGAQMLSRALGGPSIVPDVPAP